MKNLILLLTVFFFSESAFSSNKPVYISPLPNSDYVKIYSSLVLKFPVKPDSRYLSSNLISIAGDKSGTHIVSLKLSDDGTAIIISHSTPFALDEKVTVKINPVKNVSGNFSDEIIYSFRTEKKSLKLSPEEIVKCEINLAESIQSNNTKSFRNFGDPLPINFPDITVTNNTSPSSGDIFLSNFAFTNIDVTQYLTILDNTGYPVYYKKTPGNASDFKKQPNGNLTYFDWVAVKYYEMNSSYNIIDSIYCGNGYSTDLHELRILPNGHYLLMSYDPQIVKMSDYIPGGDSDATVTGLVVQELDASKNVVFQWRSWDHYSILDATHENLTAASIDYVHGNAIDMDTDGNLLISCRHMDEITKINISTGDIMWRLGGKNNQFTFINDPDMFSHQHALRRIANGNITLFDNGNFHSTNYSRAVEYKVDEINKTVKLVWQYRNSPDTYGNAMGYVQRLTNGNTIIGWGAANPTVTEVTPNGTKVFELSLPQGQFSYRAFKDDWGTNQVKTVPSSYNLYQNYPNPFNPVTNIKFDIPKAEDVNIKIFNLLGQKMVEVDKPGLQAGTYEYSFNGSEFSSGIYFYQIQTPSFIETKRMILVK